MIKTLWHWGIGFPRRAYTVMELRTGFATGLPILSTSLFASYLVGHINWLPLILFFICGFSFNIVANVANEIRAYLKNEEDDTTFTGHLGSEGLVRGDATFLDAILVLLAWLGLAGLTGLLLVYVTKSLGLFLLGCLGLVGAIGYSLGPKPYITYPVSEIASGLLVGLTSSLVAFWLQTGTVTLPAFLYAFICMVLTIFLMSTNNTGDYNKDLGVRKTLPHVIGFRASILIIIPEFVAVLLAWVSLWLLGMPSLIFSVGVFCFFYDGYLKWLKEYLTIQDVYPEMGRDFGPRPLRLIRSFHLSMSCLFLYATLL